MKGLIFGAAALAVISGIAVAGPALADVKAGVDAWSNGQFDKAVAQWRGPAAAGDADAQFNLGQAYKLGRGVPTDLAMAESWYRKAALQGHAQAEDNYGLILFQSGKKAEALPWLEKSVARDEKRAELVLGTMLFNGDGVTKDWTRAYALVTRSSQQGLNQGSQTLAQMDQFIPPAQRQQGIAMAGQVASQAKTAAVAPPMSVRTADLPPSQVAGTTYPPPMPPRTTAPTPRTVPPVKSASRPAPPTPRAVAVAPRATGGAWRIQLGAFRDEGNARSLWAKVGARTGGSPAYPKAGGVTRLQATGFATKGAAQAACGKAGVSCVVVAP